MKKDLITTDELEEMFEAIDDIVTFMHVFDNDNDANIPIRCLSDAEAIEATLLSDEENNGQAIARLSVNKTTPQYQLAQNNDDYERLLMQHFARYSSGLNTKNDDLPMFIRDIELPQIKGFITKIDDQFNVSESENEYFKLGRKYRWFLENKLKPKRNSNKVEIKDQTLWNDCIKDVAKKYIFSAVVDNKAYWKYPFLYMRLWVELAKKGYLKVDYRKLSKRDALKILINTFPDAELKEWIAKNRSSYQAGRDRDTITGRIPEFTHFELCNNSSHELPIIDLK